MQSKFCCNQIVIVKITYFKSLKGSLKIITNLINTCVSNSWSAENYFLSKSWSWLVFPLNADCCGISGCPVIFVKIKDKACWEKPEKTEEWQHSLFSTQAGNTEPKFLSFCRAAVWLRFKFSFRVEPEPSSDFGPPAEPSPSPA